MWGPVSADMVHGLHPSQVNASGANEEVLLQPKLHHGLVMRHDTVHNHAADIVTSYLFREVAKRNCIPTQVCLVLPIAAQFLHCLQCVNTKEYNNANSFQTECFSFSLC